MPTTETLIWDCPECCDSSTSEPGDCSLIAETLEATWSGGSLGILDKIADFHWRLIQFQYCLLEIDVYCVAGVVTATIMFGGNSATGITVVSANPVLITATLPAANGSCSTPCPICNQPITITESL